MRSKLKIFSLILLFNAISIQRCNDVIKQEEEMDNVAENKEEKASPFQISVILIWTTSIFFVLSGLLSFFLYIKERRKKKKKEKKEKTKEILLFLQDLETEVGSRAQLVEEIARLQIKKRRGNLYENDFKRLPQLKENLIIQRFLEKHITKQKKIEEQEKKSYSVFE